MRPQQISTLRFGAVQYRGSRKIIFAMLGISKLPKKCLVGYGLILNCHESGFGSAVIAKSVRIIQPSSSSDVSTNNFSCQSWIHDREKHGKKLLPRQENNLDVPWPLMGSYVSQVDLSLLQESDLYNQTTWYVDVKV